MKVIQRTFSKLRELPSRFVSVGAPDTNDTNDTSLARRPGTPSLIVSLQDLQDLQDLHVRAHAHIGLGLSGLSGLVGTLDKAQHPDSGNEGGWNGAERRP